MNLTVPLWWPQSTSAARASNTSTELSRRDHMKTRPAGDSSPETPKLQQVTAQALEADKKASAAKEEARLAKIKAKAARKSYRAARKELKAAKAVARKAMKQARRAQRALQACLDRMARQKSKARRQQLSERLRREPAPAR